MKEIKSTTKNAWNRLLISAEGIDGMLHIRERSPAITSRDQAGIIFEAGVTQGYKEALDRLSKFTEADNTPGKSLENE